MEPLPYHHPDDRQFSLCFVNPDESEIVSYLVDLEGTVDAKLEDYSYDADFYAVYKNESGGEPMENILSDVNFDGRNNKRIVARVLEVCQGIIDENKEEVGEPIEMYKKSEIGKIPSALDRVDWQGTATQVAGELASNLIRKHGLPNANHRTSISMAEMYLSQIDPGFSMPETATGSYGWQDWVNEYIEESKSLITVHRKNVLLKHLYEFGVREIERRNGITVNLEEYELDMQPSTARQRYTEKHEKLWTEFVETAVERAGLPELKQTDGLSKSEFAEKLSD